METHVASTDGAGTPDEMAIFDWRAILPSALNNPIGDTTADIAAFRGPVF